MIRALLRRHLVPLARRLPWFVQEPLREIWYACAPQISATARHANAAVYQEQLDNETALFDAQTQIHQLPAIAHYWADKHLRPKLQSFGFSNPEHFFLDTLEHACRRICDRPARFISIGAGNGDVEVRIACALRARGYSDFTFECLEINRSMRERSSAHAHQAGVAAQVLPVAGDFNAWQPSHAYDAVIANQSLHHVVALETLFEAIVQAIAEDGVFAISDVIGRNGHQRWPEALTLVREFWAELPPAYRYNLQLHRREKTFRDWDCAREGFEGVRAQDILPLLIERFDFEFFFAHSNLIDPFISRAFGAHFDIGSQRDLDFIDRVHARDEAEILAGRITPTNVLARMHSKRADGDARTCVTWEHLTPAFCLRRPPAASAHRA